MENHNYHISTEKLYKKYFTDILRYSFSILKSYEDARDIVQEVFLRHFEKEKLFNRKCSYKTWLLIITRNLCYSKLKNGNLTQDNINAESCDEGYVPDFEVNISLKDALLKIPSEYNELLYLKETQGYSYEEIAEITGNTVENVAVRLYRAKKMLRKILKNRI